MSGEEHGVSGRLIRSAFVTYKIVCSYGKIKMRDLLEKESHVRKTQLYKHIRILEKAGLVKRFRMDRYTYVLAAEYVDRETFEKRILEALKRKDVYDYAYEIKTALEKYDIPGDLFGACKIHEEVEQHNRITNDINVVVTKEHYKYVDLLLKSMGYSYFAPSQLVWGDHIYLGPTPRISVYVLIDGVKHPVKKNVRFFNLANVLRTKGKLDLEHAVAGKLLRWPVIRRKEDGYDIAVALASPVNLKKIVRILSSVVEKFPEMKKVIANNIAETENYLKYYGYFDKYSINKIRYSLKYIADNLGIEQVHVKKQVPA